MFRDDRKSHLRTSTTSEAALKEQMWFSYVTLVSDTNVSLILKSLVVRDDGNKTRGV